MKRLVYLLLSMLLLSGCAEEETLETVADEWMVPVMAQPREISVQLPEDLVMPVLEQDGSQLYMGDGFELMVDVQNAGDLSDTVRSMCGYEPENLTVIQTQQEGMDRYDFVWTAAGETGDRLGRGVILDDGNYHYCLSALRDQGDTAVRWREVFASFSLI